VETRAWSDSEKTELSRYDAMIVSDPGNTSLFDRVVAGEFGFFRIRPGSGLHISLRLIAEDPDGGPYGSPRVGRENEHSRDLLGSVSHVVKIDLLDHAHEVTDSADRPKRILATQFRHCLDPPET
jgi:hypothetical protein